MWGVTEGGKQEFVKSYGGDNDDEPKQIKYNAAISRFYMFGATKSSSLISATTGGLDYMLT